MIDQLPLTIGMVLAGLIIGLLRLRGSRPEAIQQQIKTLIKPGNGNGSGKYLELITRLQSQVETTRDTRIEEIAQRVQTHSDHILSLTERMNTVDRRFDLLRADYATLNQSVGELQTGMTGLQNGLTEVVSLLRKGQP